MKNPLQKITGEDGRPKGDRKATDILKEDHEKVKDLFKEFRDLDEGDAAGRRRIFDQVDRELTIHSAVEEEIFYPAVKATDDREAVDEVLEAREEHLVVKGVLEQLRHLDPSDESFGPKMKVLMEAVEHHADEEEEDMFATAKKDLESDELLRLGAMIETRKEALERGGAGLRPPASRPRPRA